MTEPVNLILLLAAAAIVPFIQQVPPNIAINALAIILSIYIMTPVIWQTYNLLEPQNIDYATSDGMKTAYETGKAPITEFLSTYAGQRERAFFLESVRTYWPEELSRQINNDSIIVILPAFMVSQLREAFEIGFLIFLPFLVIDLVISNILLALGMMMVSPLTISLPFKLLLFVMADGWSRLILGLVKTYTGS
jgi:type III secretion protein R